MPKMFQEHKICTVVRAFQTSRYLPHIWCIKKTNLSKTLKMVQTARTCRSLHARCGERINAAWVHYMKRFQGLCNWTPQNLQKKYALTQKDDGSLMPPENLTPFKMATFFQCQRPKFALPPLPDGLGHFECCLGSFLDLAKFGLKTNQPIGGGGEVELAMCWTKCEKIKNFNFGIETFPLAETGLTYFFKQTKTVFLIF